jgi:hypothetical protein
VVVSFTGRAELVGLVVVKFFAVVVILGLDWLFMVRAVL